MTSYKSFLLFFFAMVLAVLSQLLPVNHDDMHFALKMSFVPCCCAVVLSYLFKMDVNNKESWRREVFIFCASVLGSVLLIKLSVSGIGILSMLFGIAITVLLLTLLLNVVEGATAR
ncbi:hypothetical protein BM525_19810 (plasmid) [Alteromonas mediterranea]|uniref:Uncharacterized protein n=1 Tax=Alteromonas mediterranea TaxID=314275 RepID=A0AAC9NTW8_9ALTE|nr:hypothetical protein [Alteromonas mediterranea]APD92131.1 hypothetical protein BM524_19615 [Alteromonas mediterranea]APD99985.1 hypothetical protein BM525_19810 [Alteromonas mediterranea]